MAPAPGRRPVFAFPFPYANHGATPIDTVIPKKRRTASTSEAESSGDETDAADGRPKSDHNPWHNVRRELARAEPPLLPPFLQLQGRAQPKQQAISALTTVLQRCMHERDYVRAGRAFGLLLRADYYGFNLDLRSRGLYGIGAELLLRQDQIEASASQALRDDDRPSSYYVGFSQPNFADAKAYYDRLAIDYTFRPVSSSLVSSLDFYPIMYGLWISIVQDRYLETTPPRDSETLSELGSVSSAPMDSGTDAQVLQGREQAREGASAIEASLKELMISPPYSESAYLQGLQSMLGQWIRDLGREGQAGDPLAGETEDLSSPESVG